MTCCIALYETDNGFLLFFDPEVDNTYVRAPLQHICTLDAMTYYINDKLNVSVIAAIKPGICMRNTLSG